MGLILKTTEAIWFSQAPVADETNGIRIAANIELPLVSCTVVGETLQLILSTPIDGLSEGFIQAFGIISLSVPTAPTPPPKHPKPGRGVEGGPDTEPEKNHQPPPTLPPEHPKSQLGAQSEGDPQAKTQGGGDPELEKKKT